MFLELFLIWCLKSGKCEGGGDLSNIAATIIGIVAGIALGGFINWVIYDRQQRTAEKQEKIERIEKLETKQEHILEKIQKFEENRDKMLNNILTLDRKIDTLLESSK